MDQAFDLDRRDNISLLIGMGRPFDPTSKLEYTSRQQVGDVMIISNELGAIEGVLDRKDV